MSYPETLLFIGISNLFGRKKQTLISVEECRTKAIFKGESNAKFLCINEESLANYLGVEDEYLPPELKDETYNSCFGHSIMTNSGNYSANTQPDLKEEVYKDFESQMCTLSDDDTLENARDLRHIVEKAIRRSKKHH